MPTVPGQTRRVLQLSQPAKMTHGCETCDYTGPDVQRHAEETGHPTWLELAHRTIYRQLED